MVDFPGSAQRGEAKVHGGGAPHLAPASYTPFDTLLLALDALEDGFAFLDRGGGVRHASAALRRVLADPGYDGLHNEVVRFARRVWGAVNVHGLHGVVERLDAAPVRLPGGECRLVGSYVGVDLWGDGPSVLVGVRIAVESRACPERLRQRFGLTPKQARVALLLMQGLRNTEIARTLFISPHTARHHVEQIRLKVGGHTRAAVASRLLHLEP